MKKLPIVKTPAQVVIAVGLIILVSEFLIMLLIESIHATILKDPLLEGLAFYFLDPIALTAIVSPALYLLVFRPLNRQVELERQLAELRHQEFKGEIKHLAFYDHLTGLPNRRLLLDRLHQAFAFSARSGRGCALLFINLDNFKDINDTLGHDIGDILL